ncbi:MAG TPA: inorganic pyrophosphatase [Thermoanaerobaculia bacterium]|jgi:inorganic pyrophosphatase
MDHQDPESAWELAKLLFQAHPWHGVAIGAEAPRVVTAFIEIVPTDTVKYEIDKPSGHLKVDRPQQFSNVCPTLYGLIPQTFCGARVAAFGAAQEGDGAPAALEGDADPLDICVLSERAFSHGDVLLQAVPVGGLRLIDRNQADDKIVAVLKGDAAFGHCAEIGDLPKALIERLEHYFLTYKRPPGAASEAVQITSVYGAAEAREVIERSRADYEERYPRLKERFLEALGKG